MQLMLRLALDVLQMDVVMVNDIKAALYLRELADDLRQYAVGQVFLLKTVFAARRDRSSAA